MESPFRLLTIAVLLPAATAQVLPSGSPSVAPTVEGGIDVKCSAHADCGHNGVSHTYCDNRQTCFNCDYCVNIENDAIDGSCPAVCTSVAEGGCNAHTECTGTDPIEYCDQSNDCYTCSYCVNIHNDAIDGTCPERCNAVYNGNRNDAPTDSTQDCDSHADCGGASEYCDMLRACFACTYCVNIHNDAIDGRCPARCYRDGVRPPQLTNNNNDDSDDDASAHWFTFFIITILGVLPIVCWGAIAAASRRRTNERRTANDGGNRDAAVEEVPPMPMYRELNTDIDSIQNPQYDNEAMSEPRASALSVDDGPTILPFEVGATAHVSPTSSDGNNVYMEVFPTGHSARNPFAALDDCDEKPPSYDESNAN